jgi:hypothetical protein
MQSRSHAVTTHGRQNVESHTVSCTESTDTEDTDVESYIEGAELYGMRVI